MCLGSRLTVGSYVWRAVPLPEAALTHILILDNTIAARYSLYVMLGAAVIFAPTIEALRERLPGSGRRPAQAAGAVCAVLACLALLPLVPAWPYGARVTQVPRYFSSDLAAALPQGSVRCCTRSRRPVMRSRCCGRSRPACGSSRRAGGS